MELISYVFELAASNMPATLVVIVAVGLWQSLRGCFNFGV